MKKIVCSIVYEVEEKESEDYQKNVDDLINDVKDECLACSIKIVDSEGKVYEAKK